MSLKGKCSTAYSRLRPWVRWFILIILFSVAVVQLKKMGFHWPKPQGSIIFLFIVGVGAFAAHGVQASMTHLLIHLAKRHCPWIRCLALNSLGGLWGLIFPMGSVGYKAMYLRSELGLPIKSYAAYYGLAFLANLWVGLCFALWPIIELANLLYGCYVFIPMVLIPIVIIKFPGLLRHWKLLPLNETQNVALIYAFFKCAFIQGLGLCVYILIYWSALRWFGSTPSLGWIILFVVVQSWLFLAPLVPANLVILEGAGIWCLSHGGVGPEVAIASIALMRATMLVELMLLAPWAMFVLPKRGEFIKSDLDQLAN